MTIPPASAKLLTTISPSSLPSTSPLTTPSLYDDGSRPTLRPTFDAISKEVDGGQSTLIIVDGLAELLWMGFEPSRVQQFVRAVLSLARHVRPRHTIAFTKRDFPTSVIDPQADDLDRRIRPWSP